MTDCLPAPYLLGAPARYVGWRRGQADAVWNTAYSPKRFVICGAPTGFGKTLMYVCTAMFTDSRVVILTATKALSRQIYKDLEEAGVVEIKGLNAYECVEGYATGKFGDMRREGYRADMGLPMMCDEAPCQSGAFCKKRDGGCLYYDAYNVATRTKIVVTNYAYWMSINKWGEGLGDFDMIVLDEAHNAIDELSGFIGTELRPIELETVLPGSSNGIGNMTDLHEWKQWGLKWNSHAMLKIEEYKAIVRAAEKENGRVKINHSILRKARDLKRMQQKLETVATMAGDWIMEWIKDDKQRLVAKFDPIWPGEYAERNLFLGIKKVVMVSATVRPETATKLNINSEDVDFTEYPSTFNKVNRPVISIPTAPMNRKSAGAGKQQWHLRMDQIMDRRPNVKGIIHTVSYPRAREIYAGSEFKHRLLMHDSDNTKEIIDQFKKSTKPLVIVSPVLDTGYDFPHDEARFQIVAKMPFPVTVDKIVQARIARDPGYRNYVTMVKLVQMAGRICRAEDDWGETFIVDDDFVWWWKKGRWIVPRWFSESVRFDQLLSDPLTRAVA